MIDIPMGVIDPERLGCPMRTCAVFAEHARGRAVSEIAEDFHMTEDTVRGEITGVWHDDKAAAYMVRRKAREGDRE